MKILSLLTAIILIGVSGYSQSTCATSFKSNNGNGTCGAAGELRLNFPGGCPALVPLIDSVYINGVKSNVTFAVPNASKCGGDNGYISYCVTSGNMPPANVWSIFFKDTQGIYNCTVVSPSEGPLAVKLLSFEAAVTGNSITCRWSSEAEIDNDHYEVERSFDGSNFNSIAYVFSKENATVNNSYSYLDKSIAIQGKSKVFYRLKDVDKSGKVSFSSIISIKPGAGIVKSIQVSPSPFAGNLSLVVESAINGNGEIKLLNFAGQAVVTKNSTITRGSNKLQMSNLDNLPRGVYVAQVLINGVFAGNQKVVKN
ncbi:MAG: T9SS type A sorting domain-containing protein [Ferruginibacter sp.]